LTCSIGAIYLRLKRGYRATWDIAITMRLKNALKKRRVKHDAGAIKVSEGVNSI
jgi:hypothetical protein